MNWLPTIASHSPGVKADRSIDKDFLRWKEILLAGFDTPELDTDTGQVAHQFEAAAVDRNKRMASCGKLVIRLGAIDRARFDLKADISRMRGIGISPLRDVFDRDACRALFQLGRRTKTGGEGMFLAVELLAVKAVFDGLVDFFFDDVESRDEGFFAELAPFVDNTLGDRFDVDGTAIEDTGCVAFNTRQIAFADADI